jgi:hypothetical protein
VTAEAEGAIDDGLAALDVEGAEHFVEEDGEVLVGVGGDGAWRLWSGSGQGV